MKKKAFKLYEEYTSDQKEKTDNSVFKSKDTNTPFLNKFGRDVTKMAKEGKLEPIVGRDEEIEQVVWILSRKNKNNPIIIGEAGVGKTAIVEGIAQMMESDECPESLEGKRIVQMDMMNIMSGTSKQGDLERSINQLLKELSENKNIILFMDEIHMIVDDKLSIDVSNMLKPALARGEMRCIGATTNNEYRESIEKDKALERRFQKIRVEQPSVEDTIAILNKIKSKYEEFHNVEYSDESIVACVKLSDKYITNRHFPDKAIDLLDEVGARLRIKRKKNTTPEIKELEIEKVNLIRQKNQLVKDEKFEEVAKLRNREKEIENQLTDLSSKLPKVSKSVVTKEIVEKVIGIKTGIPTTRLSGGENEKVLDLAKNLKMEVIGQDDAVNKVAKCIKRSRAGLKDPNKPSGVFLFLGSTGTGKTHLVKSLAKNVFGSSKKMVRIDMSEYSEAHNVSRLIGSPPGYVGYGEGGQLTEKVRRNPYSIVLFDELEKSHPKVLNIMLQIFDDGHLTDGEGNKIDFKNTIIVMTSNIGAKAAQKVTPSIGFGNSSTATKEENAKSVILNELKDRLSPEFLNRIDDVIIFNKLEKENIYLIIDKELEKLDDKVKDRGFTLEVSREAKDFIIDKGYDSEMGARPLKRAIQNYLEDPISDEIIRGNIKDSISIGFDSKSNKITINGNLVTESLKRLITKFNIFKD